MLSLSFDFYLLACYRCININRSFFKEGADFYKLGFGLELWKGAYMSVRPSEIGLTWNLDCVCLLLLLLVFSWLRFNVGLLSLSRQ